LDETTVQTKMRVLQRDESSRQTAGGQLPRLISCSRNTSVGWQSHLDSDQVIDVSWCVACALLEV
jgi:hypothetical protein